MSAEAVVVLGRDPLLGAAVARIGPLPELPRDRRPFTTLCRSIVAQQLSLAAARTIWNRLLALVPAWTPEAVAPLAPERLRACGISGAKAGYLVAFAAAVADGRLRLDDLHRLDDAAAGERLLGIKGIGPWSVEMYLLFQLGRPDVFSLADAGLRRALVDLAGLDPWNYPVWAAELSAAWRPYRSLASRYLWRWLELRPAEPDPD